MIEFISIALARTSFALASGLAKAIARNRRTPGIVLLVVTFLGLGMLALSYFIAARSWWSGALVNLGTSVLLAGPLLLLDALYDRRTKQIEEDVQQVKTDIGQQITSLTEIVQERLNERRSRDEGTFQRIREAPRGSNIEEALVLAARSGLTSTLGPRIMFIGGPFNSYLHFARGMPRSGCELLIESEDGAVLDRFRWGPSEPAADIFLGIASRLTESNTYGGDAYFDPQAMLDDLSATLLFLYHSKVGASTSAFDFGHVIQWTPEWLLTDEAIIRRISYPYTIELARLGEMDWHKHIASKVGFNILDFSIIADAAAALIKSGALVVNQDKF
jgi:hypothetical protein